VHVVDVAIRRNSATGSPPLTAIGPGRILWHLVWPALLNGISIPRDDIFIHWGSLGTRQCRSHTCLIPIARTTLLLLPAVSTRHISYLENLHRNRLSRIQTYTTRRMLDRFETKLFWIVVAGFIFHFLIFFDFSLVSEIMSTYPGSTTF
jgi:hypothetical protein